MTYLLLANLYLCIFYGFYRIFLHKRTFFHWNRFYLLFGLLLAFTLPLLEYPEWNTKGSYPEYLIGMQVGEPVVVVTGTAEVEQSSSLSLRKALSYGYVAGCLLAFFLFLRNLTVTFLMLRRNLGGDAFSFFGIIRIDGTLTGHDRIRLHEQTHAREWHTIDILLMQLVKIFNWFNPVVYRYERAIRLQHEYIADGESAAGDEMGYAELLVARAMGAERQVLIHTFSNKRLLKSRIAMLLRDKSPKRSLLWYMLLAPIIGGMVMLSFACNQRQQQEQQVGDEFTDEVSGTGISGVAEDAKLFKEQLGKNIDYSKEALREGKQGTVAFTYEKAENGKINQVKFLNELWNGQQADILKVLQGEKTERLAPAGKYLVAIDFRISGQDSSVETAPPPPAPNDYIPLGTVTIVGYSPDLPPPPPVEPKPDKSQANTADQPPSPKVEQVRLPEEKKAEVIEESTDMVFQSVEINPEPIGGMRAFMEYISKNYDYPQAAIEEGVNGQIQVAFIVEKDGSLTDIRIIRDLGHGTGDAAIRVLQSSSKWAPGIQNGRPVRVAYTLPIRLNLQS